MSRKEIPGVPSPTEVRSILSRKGPEASIAEELVYTALGMYNDNDYLGLAQTTIDLGELAEVAAAEAKLQIIEEYDNRKPEYPGYKYDIHHNQQRTDGVDLMIQSLGGDEQNAFYEEYEYEYEVLRVEQEKVI